MVAPDGGHFVSCGQDATARLWDADGTLRRELPAAGEEAALDRWTWFREHGLAAYDEGRDRADLDGTPLAPVGTALHDHLASLPEYLPDTPMPVTPRLAISTAAWNGRTLRLKIVVSPQASKTVRTKIRLVRDRRSSRKPRSRQRMIDRKLMVVSGVASLTTRAPVGLKPSLVTASYPGDELLSPRTVRKKPSSVSKLTRRNGPRRDH